MLTEEGHACSAIIVGTNTVVVSSDILNRARGPLIWVIVVVHVTINIRASSSS